MVFMRSLISLVMLSGCFTTSAVPVTMHPTATTAGQSVGVAVGGAYATQKSGNLLSVPYGEGAIRTPVGDGQLNVHVGPGVAHVGYRYDLAPLANGFGAGIEPIVGASYYRFTDKPSDPTDPSEKQSSIALLVGLAAPLLIPAGAGFAFIVPKIGYEYAKQHDSSSSSTNDTSKAYVLGASLGIDFGNGVSVELTIHRIDDAQTETVDTPAGWLIVPTVGVHH
jgi:hypothetical protein